MNKLDDMMEQSSDVTAKITLLQQKAKQGKKIYEMIYYRRDKDDAFLIIFINPESEKGNGYLRVGDNFWMYRRNTRTFQHISRDENISSTDVKGGDFEKVKLIEQFEPLKDDAGKAVLTEESLGEKHVPLYKFTLIAKVNDVTYPKQVFWVEKEEFLPRKVESYSLSGMLMNTALHYKYIKLQGKFVNVLSKYIDEFEKGNVTVVKISDINLDKIS
ncbi:outer membrane lipoprotein-sorting protein, partial [Spirochaetota bacterium]